MKFKDIEIYTWINYHGEAWFVANLHHDGCYLENSRTEMYVKNYDFQENKAESVQPPVFQLGDMVVYVDKHNNHFHNKRVNIVNVDRKVFETFPYRVEADNERTWATPFDLTKIEY